jgi:hypothetical protein
MNGDKRASDSDFEARFIVILNAHYYPGGGTSDWEPRVFSSQQIAIEHAEALASERIGKSFVHDSIYVVAIYEDRHGTVAHWENGERQ